MLQEHNTGEYQNLIKKVNRTTEAQLFNSSNHPKWLPSNPMWQNRKEHPNRSTNN